VLRSASGPDSTILHSPQIGTTPADERLIECLEGIDSGTIIEGFRMRGGMIMGAAIYCRNASPTIRGNVIQAFGWGIDLRDSSNAVIDDNVIEDCAGFGILVFASSPIIRRNTMVRNEPRGISIGGRKSQPIIGGKKGDGNRFFGMGFVIVNDSRNDIDATWNDWGWASTTEMERYPYPTDITAIQDGNDVGKTHRGRGKVDYRNWLMPTKSEASTPRAGTVQEPATGAGPGDSANAAPAESASTGADAAAAESGPRPLTLKMQKSTWMVLAALVVALVAWRRFRPRRDSSGEA
jgi:parallel beta-helix repeat protein